jgi:S1-C subfamily serine protease
VEGGQLPDVVDAMRRAVVQIAVQAGAAAARVGSGVWAAEDGLVVTALHVLRQAQQTIGADGDDVGCVRLGVAVPPSEDARGNFVHLSAELIATDDQHDLALLRAIPNPFAAGHASAAWQDVQAPVAIPELFVDRVRDGEAVAVSGYPVIEPVLVTTTGTVASSWAFDLTQLPSTAGPLLASLDDLYLIDVTVNPGDSGAPVYRARDGAVIGICLSFRVAHAGVDALDTDLTYPSGLGVVTPAKYVARLLEQQRPA